jgi:hypothetical protein
MNQATEGFIILAGAIVLASSIFKLKGLLALLPLIKEPARTWLLKYIRMQRMLMVLFLVGYFFTTLALCTEWIKINTLITSLIFFLSGSFVYLGVSIQGKMIMEMMKTLRVLMPICMKCKKIRNDKENPEDHKSWVSIDSFIAKRANIAFTHGICPSCQEEMLSDYKTKE